MRLDTTKTVRVAPALLRCRTPACQVLQAAVQRSFPFGAATGMHKCSCLHCYRCW